MSCAVAGGEARRERNGSVSPGAIDVLPAAAAQVKTSVPPASSNAKRRRGMSTGFVVVLAIEPVTTSTSTPSCFSCRVLTSRERQPAHVHGQASAAIKAGALRRDADHLYAPDEQPRETAASAGGRERPARALCLCFLRLVVSDVTSRSGAASRRAGSRRGDLRTKASRSAKVSDDAGSGSAKWRVSLPPAAADRLSGPSQLVERAIGSARRLAVASDSDQEFRPASGSAADRRVSLRRRSSAVDQTGLWVSRARNSASSTMMAGLPRVVCLRPASPLGSRSASTSCGNARSG